MERQLAPDDLRWTCAASRIPPPPEAGRGEDDIYAVGQARALAALELGVAMKGPGYNVFVTGLTGSGRTYTIERLLRDVPRSPARRSGRAYVHNFDDPSRPRLLTFAPGEARAFKRQLRALVEGLQRDLPRALESDEVSARRHEIGARYAELEGKLLEGLKKKLNQDQLALVTIEKGDYTIQAIVPLVDGKPVPFEALHQDPAARSAFTAELARARLDAGERLPADEEERRGFVERRIAALEATADERRKDLEQTLKEGRRLARQASEELRAVGEEVAERVIGEAFDELLQTFDAPEVQDYLRGLAAHLLENLWVFAGGEHAEDDPGVPQKLKRELLTYEVNVIQDRHEDDEDDADDVPVVVERHPTFTNLFGTIERDSSPDGPATTDFTRVRGGSLLRAEGGFLVMYARDVLLEPGVWRNLVRTIKSRELEIQAPDAALFFLPSALKPEPIPVNVKIILIGDELLYRLLSSYEEDFGKIFKVKAEFDRSLARDDAALGKAVEVVRSIVAKESLLPLSAGALAALMEEAARRAGQKDRLSTRFGEMADLVREADYWAKKGGAAPAIEAEAVHRAVSERRRRQSLVDEHISRALREEVLLVDTSGSRAGQINGLAVYGLGTELFGKPTRITAAVGAGRGGLVNIEREARMSGPSHDKGVLILAGYLRQTYGQERPLALSASIAFEQSYGGVDGDSATLAELLSLLSAIAQEPVRQSVAITGSMNQRGDAQAIGGVNEKIEGFFAVCMERGLTGEQGCIIPQANVNHLMLAPEVVAAVEAGRFSVWAVDHVDDAIPRVFGVEAEALHAAVRARLGAFFRASTGEPEVRREEAREPPGASAPRPPEDPRPPTPTRED